jgi:hypothetical protein
MQVDNPKAAKLYTNLINDGYTSKNLGSIDEFSAALSDPVKADKIYNGLISDGYTEDNLGSQKEFMQTFAQGGQPKGFSAKINQGEPQKPLPFNQEQPEQPEQQPEKPTIENNFGLNHDQIALNQQSVSDNTTNVAPKEALQGEYNEAHIPEFNQQKADYKEKVLKATPDAITNAAKKSLQIKGIDPNNAALLNKEKQNFQDQISSGNAAVSFDKDGNPGLVQTPGLFGSLWDHLKTGVTNLKDARDFKNMTDQERVDYANKHPQTPYIGVKPTQAGSVGALIGDIAPTMGRYAAGAAVGGALSTLAPETGGLSTLALKPVMSFALNEGADANISGMNGTLQRFYALRQKNPQGDQVEQMKEARNGEDVDRMAGVATAGLFSMVGNGELGSSVTGNILKKIASVPVKDAETTAASGISKLASNAINSGLSLGEKTSVVEGAKDIGHNLEGVTDKNASNIASDMAQAFAENAPLGTLLDAGIGVLSGVVKAPPIIKSAIKYDLLTKIKPEVFQQALQKGLDGGALTPDQYQKTISSLQEFDNVLKTVPDYLSDESKSSVAGLILKRNSLEQQNETLDPTARKLNQPEIDGINNQINEIYRTGKPLENEINPATGKTFEPPTYDDVAQQQVKDLAQNIAKGRKIEKPEDIQTQANFPDQLKTELQKLSDEEKSADVVGEKPKTVVQDNIKNYLVSRETKDEVNSINNSESDNSEQNNVENPKPTSSPIISDREEPINKAISSVEETAKELNDKYFEDKRIGKQKQLELIDLIPKEQVDNPNTNGFYRVSKMDENWVSKQPKEAQENIKKLNDIFKEKNREDVISEAYHKAKQDGSNPELVKAVEDLLTPKEPTPTEEQPSSKPTNTEENNSTGKEIEPHKEVKANKNIAIKDVLPKYPDLKEMEAGMLHQLGKNGEVDAETLEDKKGLKGVAYSKLYDNGYLEIPDDFSNNNYVVSEKGKKFIDNVDARLDTRKSVKAGTDLFPEEANIPEFKLNKSQIRIAKEKIPKKVADRAVQEGITLDNIDDFKHLFNEAGLTPEDFKNVKEDLNGHITEPTATGQQGAGNGKTDESGTEIQKDKITETKNPSPEKAGDLQPEAEKNIGKTAFARSNSYSAYRELHPSESVEDYNKLRSSDVEIPTKDLRELSKKYVKEQTGSIESAKNEHYEEIAGSKPNKNTGRIAVDPIIGEVKDLSKILREFTTSVKQKVLNAKPGRRGVAGTYNPANKGIKLKYSGDLDTTAHEIGHMIDDQHSIIPEIINNPEALKELPYFMDSPAASKPPKEHPNPTRYKQNEGFAEWLRAFIVNPKEAINKAPEIYKIYTSEVDSKMQLAIQTLSDDIRVWAGATGRDQVLSNIEFKPEEAHGLIKKIFSEDTGNFTVSFADKMAAQFTKPLRAFEKAFDFAKGIKGIDDVLPENDPVILSRLLLGIDGKFGEIIKNGMINSKNEILKTGDGKVKNLEWLLEPLDNSDMKSIENDLKDVVAYMTAERTVELRGRFDRASIISGIGGGIYRDVDVAKKALEEFKTGDPNRLERIEEAASRYREFADDVLKYMRDKGRLSKEQYEAIKKDNLQYVAMKRIFESEPGTELTVVGGKGGKMASVTNPINKIKGSTKKITNPYTSLLESVYTSVREADRNEVLKAFRDMLVETRGMNEGPVKNFADIGVIGKEGDKNAIKIFINGKPENWLFQQDIYKALKGLDHDGWKLPPFIRVLPALLRNTVTMFPTFAARNIVRDTQDRIIKSNASNLKDLFGDKQHWNDVARAGGLNAGFYVKDRAHYYGLLETTMDDLSKNKKFILADPVRLKEVWERYEGLLQKSETVNRVAEYRGRFRKAKKEGMDDYNAMLYSAYHARDLVDFAVAGHFMKIVNQIVPFSNAAVQGIRSGIVKMKENPAGFAARMAIYSILPNAALWYWNHRNKEDGDEYESLPRYQRDLYWNAKIGDNKWLSVPKPYELSLMGAGIDRLLSKIQYGEENAFDGYAGTLYQTLMPVDDANFGAPLTPIVEGVTNHDFFRDKTIIPANEDGLNLALRHTETASRLGHLLQKATGIDGRQIDHFIRGQFSYVGNAAIKLSDIDKDDSKNEFNLTDLGFFKQSPAYNSTPVQDMLKFAEEWNLKTSRDYKDFSKEARNYFDKKTDAEKDEAAKPLVEHAKLLLMKWKREGIDQQKIDKFNSKNKK